MKQLQSDYKIQELDIIDAASLHDLVWPVSYSV